MPLLRNEQTFERPADQTTITQRYTQEAVKFIQEHKDEPFFLYLPHSMPHVPLFRTARFAGTSLRGLYGDVIEEIDWSVGQVLDALRSLDLDEETLVLFSSDNGPWLIFDEQGGSAGLLRGGKGSTWEGGMREPTLAWWPGQIEAGSLGRQIASTMDVLATVSSLTGASMPKDRTLDSHDLSPMLLGQGEGSRRRLFYYRGYDLMAVREGPWKVHFMTQAGYGQAEPEKHDPPLLFNLDVDPSEKVNLAEQHPGVIANILESVRIHQADLQPAPSQLEL